MEVSSTGTSQLNAHCIAAGLGGQVLAVVDIRGMRGNTGGWGSEGIMRLFRTRLHAYVSLVVLACVLIAGIVVLLLPRERVTRANFEKIEIGMSLADVERLLGPPSGRQPMLGMFQDGRFVWDGLDGAEELRRKGYGDYDMLGWASPGIEIVVFFDIHGIVVDRLAAWQTWPR
jgi:hypothetical protein